MGEGGTVREKLDSNECMTERRKGGRKGGAEGEFL